MNSAKCRRTSLSVAAMPWTQLFLAPLFAGLLVPITIFITYIIGALNGHHQEDRLPYISDSGNWPPESCLFSQLCNVISFLLIVVVMTRAGEVSKWSTDHPERAINRKANNIAITFGVLSSVGLNLVANFQQVNAFWPHMFGALLLFVFGSIYLSIQAVFTLKMIPEYVSITIALVRCLIAAICCIFTVTVYVFGWFSWTTREPIFATISSAMEWTVAFGFSAYLISFVSEFRKITVYSPQRTFQECNKSKISQT